MERRYTDTSRLTYHTGLCTASKNIRRIPLRYQLDHRKTQKCYLFTKTDKAGAPLRLFI